MNRLVKQIINTFITSALVCLLANITLSQPSGFNGAKPETIPENSATIKCRAGNDWIEVELIATGFNFDSRDEAEILTEEVLRYAGYLPKVITAKEAKVPNALMCRSTQYNYILYNIKWFKSMYEDTEERWADRGIFAHELGHFYNNDDLRALGSTPPIELEADEFAGSILAKMGATLEQAQAAFRSKRMRSEGSHTHPPTEDRLKAVEKGWKKVNPSFSSQKVDDEKINQQVREFLDRGLEYFAKEDDKRAIDEYTKAIKLKPKHFEAYLLRGRAKGAIYQIEEAIVDFNEALKINPSSAEAFLYRGFTHLKNAETSECHCDGFEEAISDFVKAAENKPELVELDIYTFVFERALQLGGNHDNDIINLSKLIKINPRKAEFYRLRGFTYLFKALESGSNSNELKEAISDFVKTAEIKSELAALDVYHRDTLNTYPAGFDEITQTAITSLSKLIKINPQKVEFYLLRASFYRMQDKSKLAEGDEKKAKSLQK